MILFINLGGAETNMRSSAKKRSLETQKQKKRVCFCTIGPIHSGPEYVQGDVCSDARQKYFGRILSSDGSDRPFSIQIAEFRLNSL